MPASSGKVVIHGYRDFQRALARADKAARADVRSTLREAADPVARTAEQMAGSGIRRIGARWSRMRVGVTTRAVYVAPQQRGVKSGRAVTARRPNLAGLLMNRALDPALAMHAPRIERDVERALDKIADRFNGGV